MGVLQYLGEIGKTYFLLWFYFTSAFFFFHFPSIYLFMSSVGWGAHSVFNPLFLVSDTKKRKVESGTKEKGLEEENNENKEGGEKKRAG